MVHSSPFINLTPLLPIVGDHLHDPLQSIHEQDTAAAYSRGSPACPLQSIHQPDTTAAYSRGSPKWSTPVHSSKTHKKKHTIKIYYKSTVVLCTLRFMHKKEAILDYPHCCMPRICAMTILWRDTEHQQVVHVSDSTLHL